MRTGRIVLQSDDGGRFAAVLAQPVDRADGAPSVLVLPDGRGLDDDYAVLASRLAADAGCTVLAVDLYGRTAGTGPRPPGFVSRDHSTALRWSTVGLDLTAAAGRLRDLAVAPVGDHQPPGGHEVPPLPAGSQSKQALEVEPRHSAVANAAGETAPVVAVGFCLGGRVALLAATRRKLRLAGAAAFYPQTHGPARSDLPAPEEYVDRLSCPVLTVFGGADELIPSPDIAAWRAELAVAPVRGEVVVLPDAPHAFVDRRAAEFPAQAADAWGRLLGFLDRVRSGEVARRLAMLGGAEPSAEVTPRRRPAT